jgi:hypothetical protein
MAAKVAGTNGPGTNVPEPSVETVVAFRSPLSVNVAPWITPVNVADVPLRAPVNVQPVKRQPVPAAIKAEDGWNAADPKVPPAAVVKDVRLTNVLFVVAVTFAEVPVVSWFRTGTSAGTIDRTDKGPVEPFGVARNSFAGCPEAAENVCVPLPLKGLGDAVNHVGNAHVILAIPAAVGAFITTFPVQTPDMFGVHVTLDPGIMLPTPLMEGEPIITPEFAEPLICTCAWLDVAKASASKIPANNFIVTPMLHS